MGLPSPHQLAALGPVLCLYRAQVGGELDGWAQAVRAEFSASVDIDGAFEYLLFHDRADDCCWRLYLLPDSDVLAWERLIVGLPHGTGPDVSVGVGERLWRRLAGRVRSGYWLGSLLRLHALPCVPDLARAPQSVLAASLSSVSAQGAAVAQLIARREGIDDEAFDDCCCRQATAAARYVAHAAKHGKAPSPLIHLNQGKPA